jgi:hypothetical protein
LSFAITQLGSDFLNPDLIRFFLTHLDRKIVKVPDFLPLATLKSEAKNSQQQGQKLSFA